jgi:hypothetical protein
MSTYLDGALLGSQPAYDSTAQKQCIVLSSAALGIAPPGASASPPEFIVTELDYVRVWQRPGNAKRCAVRLPGVSSSFVQTPNHASLAAITAAIDIRIDLHMDNWKPAAVQALATRAVSGGNWSWQFAVRTNGAFRLTWSADGTATTGPDSAVPTVANGDRLAVRVTLVGDNGSSQRVLTYYTAPTMDGPWTQLGTPSTGAVSSIFAGTAALNIGSRGTIELLAGLVYEFEVRDGVDGPVVTHFDATDKIPGATDLIDETGKVYTLNGNAVIVEGIPKPDLYRTSSPLRLA